MERIQAIREHLEGLFREALISDNVPLVSVKRLLLDIQSGVFKNEDTPWAESDRLFGKARFELTMDFKDPEKQGRFIGDLVRNITDKLKTAGYVDVTIRKDLSDFKSKCQCYTTLYVKVGFRCKLLVPYHYWIRWQKVLGS